jgi:methylmalonyl-CoA/ethylmalonyl-CoA epimerase
VAQITENKGHAMLTNVEHIGIAVADLRSAELVYTSLLNVQPYKREAVESESVITAFFKVNQTKIELLQATDTDSAIAKFIEKRGEGVHHLAFEVEDIYGEMERLRNEGFVILNEQPKRGADNKLVCFLHPSGTHGVLIELCQEIKP